MSKLPHFAAYAAAFEKAFVSDDWSAMEPYFTEDAVYDAQLPAPMGGRFEGRPAILAYFKFVLDHFDRRFESRELALLDGPKVEGDSVWLRGSATYRAEGVPELVLVLEETLHFDGERIRHLDDRYEPAMTEQIVAYAEEHGAKLGMPRLEQVDANA